MFVAGLIQATLPAGAPLLKLIQPINSPVLLYGVANNGATPSFDNGSASENAVPSANAPAMVTVPALLVMLAYPEPPGVVRGAPVPCGIPIVNLPVVTGNVFVARSAVKFAPHRSTESVTLPVICFVPKVQSRFNATVRFAWPLTVRTTVFVALPF